ncbi:tetratricopeptide repeat protein [Chryseobacterium sp.]|uniref:tetratricopeptide repeat protein n=1 Tax=Chryseobacterium sp. TaxID=1871047 RepID=UPI002FC9A23B
MMNARVLELLKNPKNIQSEDLHLLKEEIISFPYIQNIRALHLYGVHLFDKENYQKELSTTAAYTTDKKILYQLINGKILPTKIETVEKEAPIIVENKTKATKEPFWWVKEKKTFPKHDYKAISESLAAPKAEIKHVVVNGERNRILFEGEENFLDENHSEIIDLESTLESGVIVTQKSSFPIKKRIGEDEKSINDTPFAEVSTEIIPQEEIINPEKISEKSEVGSVEVESFKPAAEVQPEESVEEETTENSREVLEPEVTINDDATETEKTEEEIIDEADVNFAETESFESEAEVKLEESIEDENSIKNTDTEVTTEVLNPETIINEDEIDSKEVAEDVNDESQLSFHGTDSFLPEVKVEANVSEQVHQQETPKSTVNKHEDEMRRLIEEVEKKMKAHKQEPETNINEPKEEIGGEISFADTQDFVVETSNETKELEKVEIAQEINDNLSAEENQASVSEVENEEKTAWKPMNFESHAPDSFSKKIEIKPKPEEKIEAVKEVSEEIISEEERLETIVENKVEESINEVESLEQEITSSHEKEEAPVMNVSFFGADISSLAIQKEEEQPKEKVEELPLESETQSVLDSNVPGFINTWQSWLKIDRTDDIEKVKIETKNKVIESFIENNPKISQLKDEVNFVVKEKTDDISHLMTETLATLYIEQKLYTKAIKAFQVLINKHPQRKEYFENKIQEIKDSRGKN